MSPEKPEPDVASDVLTAALARFATGVTVLSVQDTGEGPDDDPADDLATTVTAFMPVSLFPPVLAVAVDGAGYLAEVLNRQDEWAISILSADQTALAGRFAAAGRPSARLLLAGEPHHRGELTGALLLEAGCATFECRTRERSVVGDHLLLLGTVLGVTAATAGAGRSVAPLVRFDRSYRALGAR